MTDNKPVDSTPADAAINRVLEAEQAAQGEIAECRHQALAILREARARARAVSERADRRIGRVHAISDNAVGEALARIAAETDALDGRPELTPALLERLDTAIGTLLDEMLSEGS